MSAPYRPDIDGLRALAVIPVVLFHAGVPGFDGGFTGVDVFFVISGFLITRLLRDSLEAGTFTLTGFYDRRIRRIVPVLLVVSLVTALASAWLLLPGAFGDVGRALEGVATLRANHVFSAVQADYWNQHQLADQPLLHTWSLVVEEQFYVAYPLLLWGLLRWRGVRPWMVQGVIVLLAAASLGLSEWWLRHGEASAAFYLLPSRAWELLLGGLLALRMSPETMADRRHQHEGVEVSSSGSPRSAVVRSQLREAAGVLGLMLLGVSTLGLNGSDPFPGWRALVPCGGAALLIWAGSVPAGIRRPLVTRALSWRPLVAIGLVSYSLYLWHWPVQVLVGSIGWAVRGGPVVPVPAQLAVMALLAWASWHLVEQPFRRGRDDRGRWSATRVCATGLVALVVMFGVGRLVTGVVVRTVPVTQPLTTPLWQLARDFEVTPGWWCEGSSDEAESRRTGGGCLAGLGVDADTGAVRPRDEAAAAEAAPAPAVAVLGDSHARMYIGAIGTAAREAGVTALVMARSRCMPMLGVRLPARPECEALTRASVDYVIERDIPHVVLAGYWVYGLPDPFPTSAAFEAALRATVVTLVGAGRRVSILRDVSRLDGDRVPQQATVQSLHRQGGPVYGPSLAAHREAQAAVDAALQRMADEGLVTLLDPAPLLCDDTQGCLVAEQGRPLYRDRHHLTDHAALRMAPLFGSAVRVTMPPVRP